MAGPRAYHTHQTALANDPSKDISATVWNADLTLVNIPGTDIANTFAATQTFTLAPVFTDASGTRTALGLAIGTNVQAYNANLAAIAALTPSNDDIIQRKAGAWTNRTMAQLATDLGVPTLSGANTWTNTNTFTDLRVHSGSNLYLSFSTSGAFAVMSANSTFSVEVIQRGYSYSWENVGASVRYASMVASSYGFFAGKVYFLSLMADAAIGWGSSTTTSLATPEIGLIRLSATQLGVTTATSGNYADLRLRNVRTEPTTVASLVAAATAGAGARSFVTDASTTLILGLGTTVSGGGSNKVPVYCDGTSWLYG